MIADDELDAVNGITNYVNKRITNLMTVRRWFEADVIAWLLSLH